jgi:hypothetical protein
MACIIFDEFVNPKFRQKDAPVKIRPDYPFLAFTTIEHLGAPPIANYSSFYQLVILFSILFRGIIQD